MLDSISSHRNAFLAEMSAVMNSCLEHPLKHLSVVFEPSYAILNEHMLPLQSFSTLKTI